MAAPCGGSLHVCTIRATRLDTVGVVEDPPDNLYVSDKPIQVQLTPTVEQGADLTLTGGCDCQLNSFRGTDKLKRFEFEVNLGALEAALQELLIGGTLITDTDGTATVPVGLAWPAALGCGEAEPVAAFEFWTDHWNGDAQDPTFPYIHHVYPQTRWQIGQQTYQNDFAQPVVTGFTRQNLAWGEGPHGDGPPGGVEVPNGGWWYSADVPPEADCDYQDVTPTT